MLDMQLNFPYCRKEVYNSDSGVCVCVQVTKAIGMAREVTTACTTVHRRSAGSALLLFRVWTWPHFHLANVPGTTVLAPETWTRLELELMTEGQVRHLRLHRYHDVEGRNKNALHLHEFGIDAKFDVLDVTPPQSSL